MTIVELFNEYFWQTATASVQFIVPVLALALVFKLVGDLLWK